MEQPLVTREDDGLIVIDYGNVLTTAELIRYATARHKELAPGKKSPVLSINDSALNMNGEIVKATAEPELVELTAAVAIVVKSKVGRTMGNIFIKINRNPYPTKMFTDEVHARTWLKQYAQP